MAVDAANVIVPGQVDDASSEQLDRTGKASAFLGYLNTESENWKKNDFGNSDQCKREYRQDRTGMEAGKWRCGRRADRGTVDR